MSNQSRVDQDIEISITEAQSYHYDLTKQTYTVYRAFDADSIIHFKLSADEKKSIIQMYYDLGLDIIEGEYRVDDECMIMPKLYTTVLVRSKTGLQEIVI